MIINNYYFVMVYEPDRIGAKRTRGRLIEPESNRTNLEFRNTSFDRVKIEIQSSQTYVQFDDEGYGNAF